MSGLFIEHLAQDPAFYFSVVLSMIVSITLHELAHGWAALWQGDDTPRVTGHLTGNPLVHMGPISLAAVALCGLGWGAMPVDPSRFRSRYGDALVSLAGPAMNLLLALLALSALMVWHSRPDWTPLPDSPAARAQDLLWLLGYLNIALCIFNLLPVPPLDGSRILAGLVPGFADLLDRHQDKAPLAFMALFILVGSLEATPFGLFRVSGRIAMWYLQLA